MSAFAYSSHLTARFRLNAVVADIRQRDGLGMITVLRNVAEVHPQQTLVALRLVLEPKAVTDTIRRGKLSAAVHISDINVSRVLALEHLPLLSNWMAIAPNDDRTSADPDKESEGRDFLDKLSISSLYSCQRRRTHGHGYEQ